MELSNFVNNFINKSFETFYLFFQGGNNKIKADNLIYSFSLLMILYIFSNFIAKVFKALLRVCMIVIIFWLIFNIIIKKNKNFDNVLDSIKNTFTDEKNNNNTNDVNIRE